MRPNIRGRRTFISISVWFKVKEAGTFNVPEASFMRLILLAAAIMILFCFSAYGQKTHVNPIESALRKCLATAKANLPRAECYSNAEAAWEKDVDSTYKALIAKLSAADRPAELKTSVEKTQSAWEQFRDAEFDLFSQEYGKKRGTGYIIPRITMRIDVIKPRALELERLLAAYE